MKKQKLIDGIIKEPLGGAHFDRETAFKEVEKTILKAYDELKNLSAEELVKKRMDKYANMGVFKG
jgi:acetyl-CoA carboxylase carboxyl transferase subunit alpha